MTDLDDALEFAPPPAGASTPPEPKQQPAAHDVMNSTDADANLKLLRQAQDGDENVPPSILQVIGAFLRGGLHGVAKAEGVKTPEWTDKVANVLQNPDLNTAIGMAAPVVPAGFQQNLLRLLKDKSLSERAIAQQLGVGKATVARHIAKLGLESRPTSVEAGHWGSEDSVKALEEQLKSGKSFGQIARDMGLSSSGSVAGAAARRGLSSTHPIGKPPGSPGTVRRWGGTAEGFPVPISQQKPTLPKVGIGDPGEEGDPWLMQQLGYFE